MWQSSTPQVTRQKTLGTCLTFLMVTTFNYKCLSIHRMYMDYAIMTLKKKISFNENVVPACLPSPGDDEKAFGDDLLTVSGWGQDRWGEPAKVLKEAKLLAIPTWMCKRHFEHDKDYTFDRANADSLLCAGTGAYGESSACNGDSGGERLHITTYSAIMFVSPCHRSFDLEWQWS